MFGGLNKDQIISDNINQEKHILVSYSKGNGKIDTNRSLTEI